MVLDAGIVDTERLSFFLSFFFFFFFFFLEKMVVMVMGREASKALF